jgi:hypothetical protein
VTLLTSYNNLTTADYYGAQQSDAYPGNATYFNPFTGLSYQVSPSFRGFGTTRSLTEQLVYVPSQAVTFNLTFRANHDFPKPLAGPIQLTGDTVNFVNFGVSPYEADIDVRFRLTRTIVVDVSRSNYFNFGGVERWTPQFQFQLEK